MAGPDISKERAAPHPIFTLPEGFRSRLRRLPPASGTASGSGAARRFRRGAFRSGLRPLPDSGAALRNPEVFTSALPLFVPLAPWSAGGGDREDVALSYVYADSGCVAASWLCVL